MAVIIAMPKLSDTMEEGGVAAWMKSEGDFVEEGEPFVEIETDKATMEYSAPDEGYLLKILVSKGSAALNAPIAILGEKGEDFDLDALLAAHGSRSEAAPEQSTPSTEKEATDQPTTEAITSSPAGTGTRIKASPLAKKMAKAQGIELSQVAGSGPSGRIIARDIEGHSPATATVASPGAATRTDRKIPLTMMRKTIAKRLSAAKNNAPHFYLTVSVDMENMEAWRSELKKEHDTNPDENVKVTVNDLVIFACSRALRKHPIVNSSWQEDHILEHGHADISMAVALPTGLVTPVIRQADQQDLSSIALSTKALGQKAKAGELQPQDYEGGTFTVSNLGMTCIEEFTAIINPPQACILAVGRTQKTPVVDANDNIVVRKKMKMTLSCDHRVVDGLEGARFLDTLKKFMENPLKMLY